MKRDMSKIITEDGRTGGGNFGDFRNCKGNAFFDDEFSGGKESMMKVRRRAMGERKSQGDNLSALKRYIQRKVGYRWKKVALTFHICRESLVGHQNDNVLWNCCFNWFPSQG